MARHLRVEFPGAIYHVTCRMIGDGRVDKSRLFSAESERARFLEKLGERVEEFDIRLYLFVLMTNHLHLVLETPGGNCSRFMQSLSTAYTVYYNLRHGRHGHLLDGRYKAKLVDGDDYLLRLSRYVHLNPVMVGAQKNKPIEERIVALRAYKWSSYPGYIDRSKVLDFVEYGPILSGMGGKWRNWPGRYRAFVESGLAETDEDFKVALKESPRSIGGDGFRTWVDELYEKRVQECARPEDASFRHVTEPLSVNEVLAVLCGIFEVEAGEFYRRRWQSPLRSVAARFLIRYCGLNQRDAADVLKIGSGAAVCNQLRRLALKLASDRRLRGQVEKAEEMLQAARKDRSRNKDAKS